MIWRDLEGWFDHEDVYREQVEKASNGAVFVEVGTYLGQGAACMAELIRDSGKRIDFYTIDDYEDRMFMRPRTPMLVQKYLGELAPFVRLVRSKSWEGPTLAAVDFCWIDAGHDYEDVKRDLERWRPVSRVIGGDDYGMDSVRQAVTETLGRLPRQVGRGWIDP